MDDKKEEPKVEEKVEGSEPIKQAPTRAEKKAELEEREANIAKEEELQTREDALKAKRDLGGESEAGQTPKKESEDEKWAKDAKERYAGTGMDPTPDDSPTELK